MSEEEQNAVAKDPELAAHFLERAKQGDENCVYECLAQVGESQQDTHGNNSLTITQSSCEPSPEVSETSSNLHGTGFPAKRWTDAPLNTSSVNMRTMKQTLFLA